MICVKLFVGGEIQYDSDGAFYSIRPKFSFPVTVNHAFDYLKNEIYKRVGCTVSQASLEIQARFNIRQDGQRDYQLIPVTDQESWKMILDIVTSFQQRLLVLDLYVELESNHNGFNSQLDLNSQIHIPSSNRILEPRTRPSFIRVRKPVPDYSHVPVDAIDDDSLESGDEMLSDEIEGSDEEVRPTSQSQSQLRSRVSQYPITVRDNMSRTFDKPLAVGTVYESKASLRAAINKFHLEHNYKCKVKYNGATRFSVVCTDDFCKFSVIAKPHSLSGSWIIKKQAIPHTCKATPHGHYQLTAELVARAIDNTMRKNMCATINHIRDVIKATYRKVTPKYNKLWRGRELAIANLLGSWENSYNLLIPLFEAIKKTNPGSKYCVTSSPIENSPNRHFKAAAWAYGPCIAAIPFLRPVISIDACFMSGRYKGRLLMACGYDAENRLLPLAFGIVEKESVENWGFFMRWLRLEVIGNNRFMCVISDRHLGIKSVFQDPHLGWDESTNICVHRLCSQHVADNLFKHVGRRREVSDKFKIGVNKKKPRRLQEMIQDFEISCPKALDYLNKEGKRNSNDEDELPCLEKLYQAMDGGHRWGIMTTNGSESLNNVFKLTRRLPITAIVQDTFYKMTSWFCERRKKAQVALEHSQMWSNIVSLLLQKRNNKSLNMIVIPYSMTHDVYEVIVRGEKIPARRDQPRLEYTRRDFKYKVLIKNNNRCECECQKPQLTGIPCSHFMAVCREMKFDENLFINPLYSMKILARTWDVCFEPIGSQCDWPAYDGPIIVPERRLIRKGRKRHKNATDEVAREATTSSSRGAAKRSASNINQH